MTIVDGSSLSMIIVVYASFLYNGYIMSTFMGPSIYKNL